MAWCSVNNITFLILMFLLCSNCRHVAAVKLLLRSREKELHYVSVEANENLDNILHYDLTLKLRERERERTAYVI